MFKPGWYPNQRLYSWKMFEKVWDDWFTGLGHLPWISLAAFPRKKIEHMCALCSHQLQAGRIFFISMRMALACALTKRQAFTCGQGVCAIVQAGPNVCMAREVLAGMLFFLYKIPFFKTQFLEDPILWNFVWPPHATRFGYPHSSPCRAPISTLDVAHMGHFGLVLRLD